MIEKLRARYMPRFLDAARLRLSRAWEHLEHERLGGVASELHGLAGDAAMLELAEVADAARDGEIAARSYGDVADGDALATCATALERVSRELERLVAPIQSL
jgi:HPt (histidine-containing phosphotransfer) domain-containing protein